MPRPARRSQAAPSASHSITNFTRVSKTCTPNDNAKKIVGQTSSSVTTRKRKAATDGEDVHPRTKARTASFAPSSDDELATPIKPESRNQELVANLVEKNIPFAKGKRTAKTTPSRARTAHKPIGTTPLSESKRQGKTVQTKLDNVFKTLRKHTVDKDALPLHLAELVDIHRSFVKTIMIQFAHNGNNSPIDIRTLAPHISQSWGKRQVTIEDIRRCIAIQTSTKTNTHSPFMIADYGRGKICVERSSIDMAPIHEERLLKQFEINLRALGTERSADEMDIDLPLDNLSLNELPQVDIKNMDNRTTANPILNKGQRALSELKSGIVTKQHEKAAKQNAASNSPLLNPDGTKMSLLDRLRLKQLAKANEPLPPSGPELQRRAALNRVGDVAATISMLSLSNPMSLPRQAFTMAVILEKLKDSLRVPVSKEEGAACVRLIASEVAPEWLRVVTIGGRENVVVQRSSQPVDRVLQNRVQKLLA
ncbi:hypothetical protein NW761_009641 [Fusarium oxysporum]|uniref:DNA replication factor Cdt1 C-terminal domain-containing protein n=3 Tax=Fusarium oxysporum TaxID=5507 RepID=N4U1P9_FUSC1|nr:hypothetical protein FOC1_g10012959 [Fusarium oxysporum f. sp. cubense race 1]KAJ4043078.1 hypothetical protein NW758_007210 [Fusarium oxysporum]TVY66294.1 hypothetical protein Focb16_v010515 [Fusarium oxysporum f. sp. cubense]WKT44506.1 DNA replication factor Cdt1, C-terminal [Fusarium oxysporum f. sp. vasinfectum]KAJ4052647.1 hypothetical protein NW763_008809 [Fusarium oxysporum]